MLTSGWKDSGCETADCPSDCNNRGVCNTTLARPACTDCVKGWMGEACEIECHGTQTPMDSGTCVCDNGCDHGDSCEQTCNGRVFYCILGTHKMQVPYSDRSVCPCFRLVRKKWLSPFHGT